MMKTLFLTGVGLLVLAGTSAAIAKESFEEELLRASDRGRGSLEGGLTWDSEVTTSEDGETTVRKFKVRAKGINANVEALEPSRNKGEVYLFNDRTMWFFKPALKKPVAISARQKLTGQAANGDIASTHYARDYSPTLEKTEIIGGEKVHVLLLKAKANNLTYDQIRYWISDKSKRAIKAEFLTLQGKAFKRATLEYDNKIQVNGQLVDFVSRMEIVDSTFEQNKSILKYLNPKLEDHKESIFNVNNLKR
jgi:putative ABC transport system permease protein